MSPQDTIEKFTPGEADYASRLRFPQKLYGRDHELKELESAFESMCRDTSSIVFVGGYSGIGKTALVEEIQRSVSEKRGNFIRGKFDQYLRTKPYNAISQAFAEFVSRILAEPKKDFDEWRNKIQSAVGDLGGVLTEVIPSLVELIGTQPDVPKLGGQEAENRFNFVLINFLSAIATKQNPLVLFVDDLQWIDAASLRLLTVICFEFNQPGLLLVGAYRDNEVDDSHPLMEFVNYSGSGSMQLHLLKLHELKKNDLKTLLSDTLRTNKGINELEEIVFKKVHGNPFFWRRLLSSLSEAGHISFDPEVNSWNWNIDDIKSGKIADNVADLLGKSIARLPEEIKNIINLAALLGNRFYLQTLTLISGLEEHDVN